MNTPQLFKSMTDKDKTIKATTFPQRVPWANTNEARQEGWDLGVKGIVVTEEKGLKNPNAVSSRGQGAGGLPVGNGAATSNTQGHQHVGRARGTTSSSNQGHHNGEQVPGSTNSSRQDHHMDERVPGAFVVPGLNEDDSRHSEDRRNESHENSTHGITARVVDPEEEHRVLREQLHQFLREERAHEGVAVVHTAAIDGSVEHGNTAANDFNGDVEHGSMTVGQAPIFNINTNLEQASSIHMDSPKSDGFWHGTRGRLVILALVLVIVAAAVTVTLVLVPDEKSPASDKLEYETFPPTPSETVPSEPASTQPTTSEPTSSGPETTEPTPTPTPPTPTDPPPSESTPVLGANGVCENAEAIVVDGMVTIGSNVNGTYVSSSCDTQYNGRGVWYQFVGTGRLVTVSTCTKNTTDFATVLSVFSSTDGTCSDVKLQCMGAASGSDSAYYSGCSTPGTGSMVNIDSVAGAVYYASVIGIGEVVGDFGLSIFDDNVGCEDDKVAQPVDGTVAVGSNVNAAYTRTCYENLYGRGAWYRFVGTGRFVTVSTCTKNTTDFATVLSVFSSTDGTCSDDKMQCIGTASGSDSAYYSGCPTPNTGSMVSIDSVAGAVYYASVIGIGEVVGDFGLSIFDDNVGCEDDKLAQPVDGTVTVGSNVNGAYTRTCYEDYYGRGAWYRFVGTGRLVTVSTCTENTTDFATVLSVFSSTDGTCSDDKLECMGAASGSDSAYYSGCSTPNTGSMVNIDSVAGAVYYASVTGNGEVVGDFGLSIFDDTPASRRTLRGISWPRLL